MGLLNPAIGERQGSCVLTEEKVIEIRRLRKEERLTYQELGDRFGVDFTNIYCIIKRKSWKHI